MSDSGKTIALVVSPILVAFGVLGYFIMSGGEETDQQTLQNPSQVRIQQPVADTTTIMPPKQTNAQPQKKEPKLKVKYIFRQNGGKTLVQETQDLLKLKDFQSLVINNIRNFEDFCQKSKNLICSYEEIKQNVYIAILLNYVLKHSNTWYNLKNFYHFLIGNVQAVNIEFIEWSKDRDVLRYAIRNLPILYQLYNRQKDEDKEYFRNTLNDLIMTPQTDTSKYSKLNSLIVLMIKIQETRKK